jgi:hypothetical protein
MSTTHLRAGNEGRWFYSLDLFELALVMQIGDALMYLTALPASRFPLHHLGVICALLGQPWSQRIVEATLPFGCVEYIYRRHAHMHALPGSLRLMLTLLETCCSGTVLKRTTVPELTLFGDWLRVRSRACHQYRGLASTSTLAIGFCITAHIPTAIV